MCCYLLALSSQFSVFLKLCIVNTGGTLLQFLLCQSCRSLRNASLGGLDMPFLGLIKGSYHFWLNEMTSSEGPSFHPCLEPPKPKFTSIQTSHFTRQYMRVKTIMKLFKTR